MLDNSNLLSLESVSITILKLKFESNTLARVSLKVSLIDFFTGSRYIVKQRKVRDFYFLYVYLKIDICIISMDNINII